MELLTLAAFCIVLILCLILDLSILYALVIGLVIFVSYALRKGFSPREVLTMCIHGVKTARNVLTTFVLIGILTALWRASGTIPTIVSYAGALVRPGFFLPAAFLLNCLISVLTGTSFGTTATMGVICGTMGEALQISPALTGGAVLAGAYFGDRCSPVSTSALLTAELTETDIFDNIRRMLASCAVPFLVSCALYVVLGLAAPHGDAALDLSGIFSREFRLHRTALIPAILILILSALRTPVRRAMLASILSALPICIFLQGTSWDVLLRSAIFGFRAGDPAAASMIDGGGIISMVRVGAIVCLSSAYSGIFRKTGLLDGIQRRIRTLSTRITPFGAMLLTSLVTCMVACNQTLTIILTKQLFEDVVTDPGRLALDLEDSAVIVSPLIPWCIAGAVPLAMLNAPMTSLFFAFFLYLLPLWRLVRAVRAR